VAVIVLVHGIAQEQRSADDLEAEWLPALAGGLRIAGYPEPADRLWRDRPVSGGIEARMAFYGDQFLRPGTMGVDPGAMTAEQQAVAEQLAHAWLQRAATDASDPRQRHEATLELARLDTTVPAEVQGTGAALRSATAALAHVRWCAPFGLGLAIGSPLGLRTIVYERLRPQPPGFPPQVVRWVNVADRDDFVAAAPDLTRLFATGQRAGALFEGGWTVDNGAEPHRATFYLTKQQTARPIGQTLTRGSPAAP
jgi:hypothetical protein